MMVDKTSKTVIDHYQKYWVKQINSQIKPKGGILLFFYNLRNGLKEIFRKKINWIIEYSDGKKYLFKDVRFVSFDSMEMSNNGNLTFPVTVNFSEQKEISHE